MRYHKKTAIIIVVFLYINFKQVISKIKNLILAENPVNQDNILDNPNSKIWVLLSRFITFLIVAFISVLMFESMWDNMEIYKQELFIFEAFISSIFAIEYFYRLYI